MPCEVVWLPGAAKDIARLREFIQKNNPAAAIRAAQRIREATKILLENPATGKPVEELPTFRELFIPFGNGNYILRYIEEKNRVIITQVKHSKEDEFESRDPTR
ncbi:MAG: type II toxin-antitoxin system RelE/ParE family toxin [Gammaproteobacteria bacterium]|nr:type II toxin-antitoxin system RelE/ParE family toxin [Gammaproteobacteria bacterium]